LLGLFLDPEDRSCMFLWNVGWVSTDYMPLYPEDRTLHNHLYENLKSYIFVTYHKDKCTTFTHTVPLCFQTLGLILKTKQPFQLTH
jgi:hypothetical protein